MDIFGFRDELIQTYAEYVGSFIEVREERALEYIQSKLSQGAFWPDPLIQLNPNFRPGKTIDDLVAEGVLDPRCAQIFRRDKTADDPQGQPLRLHQHQEDAIRKAATGANYVLTTGTGSGKSLAYIVPVVDRILERGPGNGIKAIIIYPMNALANSQCGELEKFLNVGFPDRRGPVSFKRYTGQEDDDERTDIIATPPDILLTNFVMLELILTRPRERKLIQSAASLEFLVLDEMHTFRGRQGADVALLLRRVRELLPGRRMQCVGTSATLAGRGTWADQQAEVASLASRVFGDAVAPADIIGETLERATPPIDESAAPDIAALKGRVATGAGTPAGGFESFATDPVARWVEGSFGVVPEPSLGRLIRSKPIALTGDMGAAAKLAALTGQPAERCAEVLRATLMAGASRVRHPRTGFPVFAFRLHQFISRGDTIYATLEPPAERYLTIFGQVFCPEDRAKILLPMCFCRECGQEYFSVYRASDPETGVDRFVPREAHDRNEIPNQEAGFLHFDDQSPWPAATDTDAIIDRLPQEWIETAGQGRRVVANRRDRVPVRCAVGKDGSLGQGGIPVAFIRSPFVFCLRCGVTHGVIQRSDFPKLGTLGSEGRSTATTILASTAVAGLKREDSLAKSAQKVLSFTDNRQDASLQAGHLNDFIEVGHLRSAIHAAALNANPEGLRDESISQRVTDALELPFEAFAADPTIKYGRDPVLRALRDVVGYRVYRDLRRGWRINAPNLEQCGLLRIRYAELDAACADGDLWTSLHPLLGAIPPEARRYICETLLDFVRRELCIDVNYLDPDVQEQIRRASAANLRDPWALDVAERLESRHTAFPCQRPGPRGRLPGTTFIGPLSGFGRFLRRPGQFPDQPAPDVETTRHIICALFEGLRQASILRQCADPDAEIPVPGYRINPAALIWQAADGTSAYHDRIRMPNAPADGRKPNPFFVEHYRSRMRDLRSVSSREHTAQVPGPLRIKREDDFREGRLPILFCSPTMELGIDIRDLNAVNMRNVPPTPANYAQRSGRAGRSGQPAFVFTYCAHGSPHDQFFFKHPGLMVSGQVHTPRIDVTNEDLVRTHIHAIWLAESYIDLRNTPGDLLQIAGDSPTLELQPDIRDQVRNPAVAASALEKARSLLAAMGETLESVPWYSDGWVDEVIRSVPNSFDDALQRWRYLYRTAREQFDAQNRVIADPSRHQDHERARRLRQEAEAQLKLLTDRQSAIQSDFYSYRYFASEGFLPGYNFPRLPLSAFIPGRRVATEAEEFISRPRFLAISEFGPGALIYHEGARYQVTRVMMPVRDDQSGDLPTIKLKVCRECGYLHPVAAEPGPDTCEHCGTAFEASGVWPNLFRLQNVVTRRRERINCDEEERLRLGYELKTGVRFASRDGRPLYRMATVTGSEGHPILEVKYGDAAEVWRINLGWSRRQNPNERGFWLDVERRQWTSASVNPDNDAEEDEANVGRVQRVIPYVQDRRNSLLLAFGAEYDTPAMASLEAVLKRAIQIEYQLEDGELATEALPDRKNRKSLLLYEAAEGGAGVLRLLVEDPVAWGRVASTGLRLCHFDPETGDDLGKADHATEHCQAACYDCLLSYYNQPDHLHIDRHRVKDFLMGLRIARVDTSPVEVPRAEHLVRLRRLCDTNLERDWLDFLDARQLRLPERAQHYYEQHLTRPDFSYLGHNPAFIYVDGPPHDYPDRQARDRAQNDALLAAGITVVRFPHSEDWEAIIRKHPSIFGELR